MSKRLEKLKRFTFVEDERVSFPVENTSNEEREILKTFAAEQHRKPVIRGTIDFFRPDTFDIDNTRSVTIESIFRLANVTAERHLLIEFYKCINKTISILLILPQGSKRLNKEKDLSRAEISVAYNCLTDHLCKIEIPKKLRSSILKACYKVDGAKLKDVPKQSHTLAHTNAERPTPLTISIYHSFMLAVHDNIRNRVLALGEITSPNDSLKDLAKTVEKLTKTEERNDAQQSLNSSRKNEKETSRRTTFREEKNKKRGFWSLVIESLSKIGEKQESCYQDKPLSEDRNIPAKELVETSTTENGNDQDQQIQVLAASTAINQMQIANRELRVTEL